MGYERGDADLKVTRALPNGAATVNSDAIDLGLTSRSHFAAPCELVLKAPALVVGDLADAATMTYDIQHANAADFSDAETLFDNVLVQTGADGAGAAAAEVRRSLPTNVKTRVRARITNSASGDASDKSATLELRF